MSETWHDKQRPRYQQWFFLAGFLGGKATMALLSQCVISMPRLLIGSHAGHERTMGDSGKSTGRREGRSHEPPLDEPGLPTVSHEAK